jgi:hypothetical protein
LRVLAAGARALILRDLIEERQLYFFGGPEGAQKIFRESKKFSRIKKIRGAKSAAPPRFRAAKSFRRLSPVVAFSKGALARP